MLWLLMVAVSEEILVATFTVNSGYRSCRRNLSDYAEKAILAF